MDVAQAIQASVSAKPSSLRMFGRVAAVVVGAVAGTVSVANKQSARESAYKAALAERDATIAELTASNKHLEMVASGADEKVSSGDPVQDWIDSLE